MNKKEILAMKEEKLLNLIQEKFNVRIKNLSDTESLSTAWEIVEQLKEKGWRVDILSSKNREKIDAIKFAGGGPGTIFAQHGESPFFRSVTEGICKTSLIILALEEET